jgi:DNA-binding NarL/FixJ family response regulator
MPAPAKVLIIESNREAGSLITNALKQELPEHFIQYCEQDRAAILALAADAIDAIVAHCYSEQEGIAMLQALRRIQPRVPIVVIASFDHRQALVAAGATTVVTYGDPKFIVKSVTDCLHPSPMARVRS